MIKGVNKNVIEISDTGNDSFERAILFVRADSARGGGLTSQAREYLSSLKLRHRFYTRGRAAMAVTAIISAVLGAAATAFILLF